MSTMLELFTAFFRIGLFSFGGGYAMIPLIQSEIERHGWLSASQFADIIAVAEMTPGPIAINSATYVGYQTAGVAGGLIATTGVVMPSLILVLLVARLIGGFQKHPLNTAVFYGIRPVVVGLILSAALFIARTTVIRIDADSLQGWLADLSADPLHTINLLAVAVFAAVYYLEQRYKLHPLILIGAAGAFTMAFRLIF